MNKAPCKGCRYEHEPKATVKGCAGHEVCMSCKLPALYADSIHEECFQQKMEWFIKKIYTNGDRNEEICIPVSFPVKR